MSAHSQSSNSVTLSVPLDEQWTLHHVLLHRIEREQSASDAGDAETPPLELYQAFDAVDDGETCFTVPQLEAVQEVLATYQRATDWWEVERSQVEQLLHRVSSALEEAPADASS